MVMIVLCGTIDATIFPEENSDAKAIIRGVTLAGMTLALPLIETIAGGGAARCLFPVVMTCKGYILCWLVCKARPSFAGKECVNPIRPHDSISLSVRTFLNVSLQSWT
jgi:hypothetical protein